MEKKNKGGTNQNLSEVDPGKGEPKGHFNWGTSGRKKGFRSQEGTPPTGELRRAWGG